MTVKYVEEVLKSLSHKTEGFYLAGGTALSLFYFHHRESYDLDFFTRDFSRTKAETVIKYLEGARGITATLAGRQIGKDKARVLVYSLKIAHGIAVKIDFVEDLYRMLKPLKRVDGIDILSIEDIYMRKIFAACGSRGDTNRAGKKHFIGGRQDAKDFFDLYYLSHTFMPLSVFAHRYCDEMQVESIVVWYRTYDRMAMKLGLRDIITDKKYEYQEMERYFKGEVEELVRKGI